MQETRATQVRYELQELPMRKHFINLKRDRDVYEKARWIFRKQIERYVILENLPMFPSMKFRGK